MNAYSLYEKAVSNNIDISLEDCENIIKEYFKKFPNVYEFLCYLKTAAIVNGFVETIWGRKRFFNFTHPYLKSLRGSNIELNSKSFEYICDKIKINSYDSSLLRQTTNFPSCTQYVC